MNKKLHGLYAITNQQLMPENRFADMSEIALSAGVSILQYRDKSPDNNKRFQQALQLMKLCTAYNATLIINDDIQLAKAVDADGVHLGKDDSTYQLARETLGHNKIIGISCYNEIELARQSSQLGADYIAFGSFFSSNIKPDAPRATPQLITSLKAETNTPVCCIGGITAENCAPLLQAGADMLAVISEVFNDINLIERNCELLLESFKTTHKNN